MWASARDLARRISRPTHGAPLRPRPSRPGRAGCPWNDVPVTSAAWCPVPRHLTPHGNPFGPAGNTPPRTPRPRGRSVPARRHGRGRARRCHWPGPLPPVAGTRERPAVGHAQTGRGRGSVGACGWHRGQRRVPSGTARGPGRAGRGGALPGGRQHVPSALVEGVGDGRRHPCLCRGRRSGPEPRCGPGRCSARPAHATPARDRTSSHTATPQRVCHAVMHPLKSKASARRTGQTGHRHACPTAQHRPEGRRGSSHRGPGCSPSVFRTASCPGNQAEGRRP